MSTSSPGDRRPQCFRGRRLASPPTSTSTSSVGPVDATDPHTTGTATTNVTGTSRSGDLVAVAPAVGVRTVFRRFWPDARPYRGWIAVALLIALVIPAVEAAEIWMFKLVVDDVLVPRDLGPLAWIALATTGIVATRGLLSFVDQYLAAWVGERFVLGLRTRVFGHVQRSSPDRLEQRRMGDTLTRLTSDVASIETIVLSGVADALAALARIVVFTSILVYLDWRLALVAVVAAPLLWLVAGRVSRRIRVASREARRRRGALTAIAEERLANAALVQAYNREYAEIERFREEGRSILTAEMASARVGAMFGPLVDLIQLAAALLVIGLGTWSVAEGRLTLGGLLVFLTYLTQLYGPVRDLGGLATAVSSSAAAAERVIELLDDDPATTRRTGGALLHDVAGHVRLDDVHFGYAGAARPILDGASLDVAPGEVVALVGANGAGKSTIAKLLLGFHEPQAGSISIDGFDLRHLDITSVRDHVTVLMQETLLFHGTIRDNLALGRPGASDAELRMAASEAGADRFIDALPGGWDTVVGQRGRHISGGQRQMLAIARALLRDAPVLVLDEPTTGLDAAARAHVRAPLRRLAAGRTTLVITHDPETIAWADRVVTLDGGRIVAVPAPTEVRPA